MDASEEEDDEEDVFEDAPDHIGPSSSSAEGPGEGWAVPGDAARHEVSSAQAAQQQSSSRLVLLTARPSSLLLLGGGAGAGPPTSTAAASTSLLFSPPAAAAAAAAAAPTPQDPVVAASAAVRERLDQMRRRMRDNFEAGAGGGPTGFWDDASSMTSAGGLFAAAGGIAGGGDSASLHSWHQHMLLGATTRATGPPVVYPLDSLSTRGSVVVVPPMKETPIPTPSSPQQPAQQVHPPPIPDRSSLSGPPPSLPPPPLPPRPSFRAAETKENEWVIEPVEEEAKDKDVEKEVGRTTSTSTAAEDVQKEGGSKENISGLRRNSSSGASGQPGHRKTNSLDRGLTLAKALRAGPWPPPSAAEAAAKSSSLKRDVTMEGGGNRGALFPELEEEEERNASAEDVIQRLTDEVLAANILMTNNTDESNELEEKKSKRKSTASGAGKETQGTEKVLPSIPSMSISSSEDAAKEQTDRPPPDPHEEKLAKEEEEQQQYEDAEEPAQIQRHYTVQMSVPSRPPRPTTMRTISSPTGTLRPAQQEQAPQKISHTRTGSGNPIARDVERRLSLKAKQLLQNQHSHDIDDEALRAEHEDDSSEDERTTTVASEAGNHHHHHINVGSGNSTAAKAAQLAKDAGSLIRGVIGRASRVVINRERRRKAQTDPTAAAEDSESDAAAGAGPSTSSAASHQAHQATVQPQPQSAPICRPRNAKRGPFDFERLRVVQELPLEHTGAVLCVRFSHCGRMLATGGEDGTILVWVVKDHAGHFQDMRERYQQKRAPTSSASMSTQQQSQEMPSGPPSTTTDDDVESWRAAAAAATAAAANAAKTAPSSSSTESSSSAAAAAAGRRRRRRASGGETDQTAKSSEVFCSRPFVAFKGHTAEVVDLSWSRIYFLLSCSMDTTVRLWHVSRAECLCCFKHADAAVTCVAFLPKDDRYYVSGSLDGRLRMWHIPEKKLAKWNEVPVITSGTGTEQFITTLAFVKNSKYTVVGTYAGRVFFFFTDSFRYFTVIDVRTKSGHGRMITGLSVHGDKLLVTTTDSRIRMYDIRDKALTCKFKGHLNEKSRIRASFSPDGRHVVCGSEDNFVYLWRTSELPGGLAVRKDRNAQWERAKVHSAPVMVTTFAPKPAVFLLSSALWLGATPRTAEEAVAAREALRRQLSGVGATSTAAATVGVAAGSATLPGSSGGGAGGSGATGLTPPTGGGHVLVTADFRGAVKLLVSRPPDATGTT